MDAPIGVVEIHLQLKIATPFALPLAILKLDVHLFIVIRFGFGTHHYCMTA